MYLCFYPNCDNPSIVCYGYGGMGEPGKCVCADHIQEEVNGLYNRIKELYDQNQKLIHGALNWKETKNELPDSENWQSDIRTKDYLGDDEC